LDINHIRRPTKSVKIEPNIREALPDDSIAVHDIWKKGMATSVPSTGQIEYNDYTLYFREMILSQSNRFKVWVAEDYNKQILGWQALMPCRINPVLRNQIAESSTYTKRHSGIAHLGRLLLSNAIEHARSCQINCIVGFISRENRASFLMVKALGFQKVGSFSFPLSQLHTQDQDIFIKRL
jgi:L-amino acid N-acyltransferase YncA